LRDPMYSPDGTQILYHDASDMHIMDADSTNTVKLRDVPDGDGRFTWNGMWVSIGSDGNFE
ncbi:MAG TPA: hypothetical protein VJ932_07460, partial [Alkalispirochaeta sp.]|nr:hypothetical protein [Alkalispirochaeta sp.]